MRRSAAERLKITRRLDIDEENGMLGAGSSYWGTVINRPGPGKGSMVQEETVVRTFKFVIDLAVLCHDIELLHNVRWPRHLCEVRGAQSIGATSSARNTRDSDVITHDHESSVGH